MSMYEQLTPWQRVLVNIVVRDLEREVVEGVEDVEDFEDEATEIVSKAVLACATFYERERVMSKQTSYDDLSPVMKQQVNETIDTIREHVLPEIYELDSALLDALRNHLSRMVLTFLEIDRAKQEQQRKAAELEKLMKAIEDRTRRMR